MIITNLLLSKAEERYRTIFENAIDGIFQSTPAGKFITVNPSMAIMLGYTSPTELINAVTDIATQFYANPEQRNEIQLDLQKNGKANGFELKVLKKDKSIIWVRANIIAIKDEANIIKYFEGTVEDITTIKAAEDELRNSENKLRAFFRSTSDASVLLGKKFEVLAFNPRANKLAKSTYGDGIVGGTIFTDLIFPEVKTIIESYLQKALLGETNQAEFPIPHKLTKKSVWWLCSFMPAFDEDGSIFGIVCSATDINELKRAELKLKKQFEEIEKTNHELDHFVYSVSHDLRAPLASILGLVNVAEIEEDTRSLEKYLHMIRGSVTKLDGFIKDILDYSRNSRLPVLKTKINFDEVIAKIRENLSQIQGYQRLQFNVEVEESTIFFSDLTRIEILFSNLISNAIKYQDYSKENSTVSIMISMDKKRAHIHFLDNGIGIKSIYIDKIFDMFYRASENSVGSGLGLYITKETINKLEGSITVKSEFGKFTEFEITIPNHTK